MLSTDHSNYSTLIMTMTVVVIPKSTLILLIKLAESIICHSSCWIYLILFSIFRHFKLSLLTKSGMSIESRARWAGVLALVLPLTCWVTLGRSPTSHTWKLPCHQLCLCPRARGARNILQRGGGIGVKQRHGGRVTSRATITPFHSKQKYLNTLTQSFSNCVSQNLSDYTGL